MVGHVDDQLEDQARELRLRVARLHRWPAGNAASAYYFGEAPANAKACDTIATVDKDPTFCDTFHAADEAYAKQIYYWTTPISQCLDGRTDVKCVPYSEWSKAWTEIKG